MPLPAASHWAWDAEHGLRFAGQVISSPGVGVFAHAQLFNPGDSRVDILVEGVNVIVGASMDVFLIKSRTPADTLAGRWRAAGEGVVSGTGELRNREAAQLGGAVLWSLGFTAFSQEERRALGIWLEPGTGLTLEGQASNQVIRATFHGRERPRP